VDQHVLEHSAGPTDVLLGRRGGFFASSRVSVLERSRRCLRSRRPAPEHYVDPHWPKKVGAPRGSL
jgi:hypothetical protein